MTTEKDCQIYEYVHPRTCSLPQFPDSPIRIQATSPSPQQEATLQLANRVAMATIITLNKVVLHFHANPCLDTKIQ
jgi:hypothetical protein